MSDDLAPVYVVQSPQPTDAGGEGMGMFWLMACAMWAYAIYRYVPAEWSADVRILLFVGGAFAFLIWIRVVLVVVLLVLAGMLVWYRLG